jgi:hypothetical protein
LGLSGAGLLALLLAAGAGRRLGLLVGRGLGVGWGYRGLCLGRQGRGVAGYYFRFILPKARLQAVGIMHEQVGYLLRLGAVEVAVGKGRFERGVEGAAGGHGRGGQRPHLLPVALAGSYLAGLQLPQLLAQ